jgi:very-short-patch-repair endonuclease
MRQTMSEAEVKLWARLKFLRDRVLRSQGFRVMRFWTSQVHQEIDDVMDVIVLALEAQAPPVSRSARSTLPTWGREN